MGGDVALGGELGEDFVGELFAELDPPLVEAEDVPDDALGEDFVLVHRNQLTEALGRYLLYQDGVGRPVAFEDLESNVDNKTGQQDGIGGRRNRRRFSHRRFSPERSW